MAFTMHSHSGQFCGHAKDQLEDIVLHAIGLGFHTMGLTEHMPRTALSDLYPEEMDDPEASLASLAPRHAAYLAEAQRLQAKYAARIRILIGFEGEFIRAAEYAALVRELAAHPAVDYYIGSLHHATDAGIPIDFDRAAYLSAVAATPEKTEEALYVDYYDRQHAMLQALRPRVVGHFDLIRLLSEDPGRDVRAVWPETVWPRVVRNLEFVAEYGGWVECNTSALRKGLAEPYPARPIAEEFVRLGGRFTFSDDSHGIDHVATNYPRGIAYLESLGVREVWTLERLSKPAGEGEGGEGEGEKARLEERAVSLEVFSQSLKSS